MSRQSIRNTSAFYSTIFKLSFILFLFTNVLLFYYLYDRDQPQCLKEGTCRVNKKQRTLPREKWGQTVYFNILLENFWRVNHEWRLTPALNSSSEKIFAELNCSTLSAVKDLQFVGSGWTKSTYKISLNGRILSLKTVNIDGYDISSCLLEEDRYLYDCYLLVASKLLREIAVLPTISHKNIVKILGYCVPADPDVQNPQHTVAIFEEYGEPINVIKLLQLPWEDRLRISLGLSRLLNHLASFQEPIALNDFRRQQFVIVDGEPKLIDVDDVGLSEPRCDGKPCCSPALLVENKTICIPCVNNVCHGYNEKINIIRTGGHFIKHILPHGAPTRLYFLANKITTAYQFALLDARNILKEMEDLTNAFKSGLYRNRNTSETGFLSGYKTYNFKDVSDDFDYRCQLTVSGYGCKTSVLDSEEAAEICWSDLKCKAFVVTNITTWTGRRIAKFKKGIGTSLDNNATTLFVKL
ncbi:extracellular tyrosine-protein kinase PKDCC-like [Stegodyphus dumicola]|uniref:extracellular tyrosine-protein kinase PKDCC-like n=1 Tax=Stegodyphus dumicola TaxID=202533 RepID=UPI0015A8E0FB|nr:extracellular tyrosine-protein kinase PKDCC-like [Stegodyphus dumicola]